MCTIGSVRRYIGRYIDRLSTDTSTDISVDISTCPPIYRPTYRSIVGRQSLDDRLTVGRYISVESRSISRSKNVDTSLICHRHFTDTSPRLSSIGDGGFSAVSKKQRCNKAIPYTTFHFMAPNKVERAREVVTK